MKLTIKRQNFLQLLTFTSAVIPAKSAESQFMNFLITIDDEGVSIIASDGNISAKAVQKKMEGEDTIIIASEPGMVQTPARYLLDIVSKLAGDIITLDMVDTNFLNISDGSTDFNLVTKLGEEYPDVDLNIPADAIGYKASIKDLKALYDATAYAVATKGPRELYYGINVGAKNGKLYFLATDSYRMARLSLKGTDNDADFSFTAPVKALNMLTSIPEDQECSIFFDVQRALFTTGNIIISTRLLSGDFPSPDRLIPPTFPYSVTFDTEEFLAAADRVRIISSAEDRNSQVRLTVSRDNGVILSARSTNYGNSQEVLKKAVYTLPEGEYIFEIGFNINYAIDAVKALKNDKVTFVFASSVQMFMVRNNDPENLQIITPIRISSLNV